jgi:hypothetical protein
MRRKDYHETSCKQSQSIQNKIIKELDSSPDISRKFWTNFEIDILKKYYGKKKIDTLAKVLNRSECAITRHASYLGLTHKI